VEHLRSLTYSQQSKIDALEEELLRHETLLEKRQLDWEARELQMDSTDLGEDGLEEGAGGPAGVATVAGSERGRLPASSTSGSSAPDPDLPLAVQLETALDSLKVQSQGARELKQKLDELHRVTDEAQRKLRESEAMVLAKDKIINDLRLQVPTSVDSAIVMATVTGHGGHMEADDYEARHSLAVAQATVSSLRERLGQKEETLKRYEGLLKQARTDTEDTVRKLQNEIVSLRSDLKAQQEAYAGLRATSGPEVDPPIGGGHHSSLTAGSSSSKVIKEKIDKIHELEDEVLELQGSLSEVSRQLAAAKSEGSSHLHSLNMKQKELDDFRTMVFTQRFESAFCCMRIRTAAMVIATLCVVGSVWVVIDAAQDMANVDLWLDEWADFVRATTGSDELGNYVKGNWGKAMLELRLANSVFTLAVAALLFFGLVQNKHALCLPWLVINAGELIGMAVAIAVITVWIWSYGDTAAGFYFFGIAFAIFLVFFYVFKVVQSEWMNIRDLHDNRRPQNVESGEATNPVFQPFGGPPPKY